MAYLGYHYSVPSTVAPRRQRVLRITFAVLGLASLILIGWQGYRTDKDQERAEAARLQSEKAQAELLLWQRGDPDHPPRVGFTSGTKPDGTFAIRFIMENPSEYPVYDVSVRIWDNSKVRFVENVTTIDDILRQSVVNTRIASITRQSVQLFDNAIVEVSPTEHSKSFGAQFSTRTGAFSQTIAARNVNKRWVFAVQVSYADGPKANQVAHRKIDDGFPLNSSGDVDW